MPRKLKALLAAVVVLTALTGCVSKPQRQALNRAAAPQLKSITVLQMRPSEPTVMIMNNPGYQFGLIGALVAEANMAPKRAQLREHLKQAQFDEVVAFRETFDALLQQRGYQVIWPDALEEPEGKKTKRDMWGQRKALVAVHEGDAQLDINFGFVGYASAGAGDAQPYRPTVTMTARLMTADGKTKLFQDTFVYNNVFNTPDAVVIDPDQRFVYPDSTDLEKAGVAKADGLKLAVQAIAEKIAAQL
ncbi:MAG TPA: hypothetical protein VIG66_08005 [Noviherbaspirillum sp.]